MQRVKTEVSYSSQADDFQSCLLSELVEFQNRALVSSILATKYVISYLKLKYCMENLGSQLFLK